MNEVTSQKLSVIDDMAIKYGMEREAFELVIMNTVMPSSVKVTKEQFVAFLSVAKEYDLNPMIKEIYAFPAKGGGISPIVSIDGWMRIINGHKQFDGMVFKDVLNSAGKVIAIEALIHRKDRTHPIAVTEYMEECKGTSQPWTKWPIRMLRHKSAIQCSRYAFGFRGIYDQDEVERMVDVTPNARPNTGFTKAIESMPDEIRNDNLSAMLAQAQQPIPVVKESLTPDPIPQSFGISEELQSETVAVPTSFPDVYPNISSPIPQEPPLPVTDNFFPGDVDVNAK